MPKWLEKKLKKEADKHPDWSEERKNAYIYGTVQKFEKEHPYFRRVGKKRA